MSAPNRAAADPRPATAPSAAPRVLLAAACWGLVLLALVFRSTNTDRYFVYWTDLLLLLITCSLAAVASLGLFARGRGVLRLIRGPALLLIGSTVLVLAALEGFLRASDLFGLSYYSEMSRYILERVPDPALKYRHRRSWASAYQGVEMRFNEAGLRDDPIGPKSASEFRILAVGDSQTLGWGVDRRFIWPTRLQALLAETLHRPVRVINSGCASYETRQESRYLSSDGWAFQPDLVLLMYMDNDLEISDDPYDPWGERSLRGKSPGEILILLGRQLRVVQLMFYAKEFLPLVYQPRYGPQQFGIRFNEDPSVEGQFGWRTSMAALRNIKNEVEAHHVKLAVVHFDWISFPFSAQVDRGLREAVAPFPVVSTPEWFAGQNVKRYFNSTIDAHPNAEGSRILAEHIADFILSQDLIPPADSRRPPE